MKHGTPQRGRKERATMKLNRAHNIENVYREIMETGFCAKQSYTYRLNDNGEIVKDTWGKITVYASKEEVEMAKMRIEMKRKNYEEHLKWLESRNA